MDELTELLTPTGIFVEESGKFIRVAFKQDVELWIDMTCEEETNVAWVESVTTDEEN